MGIIPLILDHIRARQNAEAMMAQHLMQEQDAANRRAASEKARQAEPISPSDFASLMNSVSRKPKK